MKTGARARGLVGRARGRALGHGVAETRTNHQSHFTTPAFLIASRQLLEILLTHSQQTRKHFLIASFSAFFGRWGEFANKKSAVHRNACFAVATLRSRPAGKMPGTYTRMAAHSLSVSPQSASALGGSRVSIRSSLIAASSYP